MVQMIAYLDCSHGISETMLFGAVLDLGFPLAIVENILQSSPVLRGCQIRYTTTVDVGVRGTSVSIIPAVGQTLPLTMGEIKALPLEPAILRQVLAVCQCLVEAEMRCAGVAIDDLSAYPVGHVEELVSVIGVVLGLDFLLKSAATDHRQKENATQSPESSHAGNGNTFIAARASVVAPEVTPIYASPLPLTSGMIHSGQGSFPTVLAITLEMLRRVKAPWRPSAIEAELVTPWGAALLATLACFTLPACSITRIGYGWKHRDITSPGYFRLCIGEVCDESVPLSVSCSSLNLDRMIAESGLMTDEVMVIESQIDNMSGELLGGFMDRLFSLGALDVSYTPIQMKKNRPATQLTILCPPEIGAQLALLALLETTTLGVRMQQVRRLKAQRYQTTVATVFGPVLVKVKQVGSRIVHASPEYEECQRIAHEHGRPLMEVYDVVRLAIQNEVIEKKEGGVGWCS
jgi:uncharacterized protein (DUF111 family)